jgi:methionyl-tRNA formyltransferase
MGTPDFAVPGLEALLDNGYDVIDVITQPDRARQRGRKVVASPVKQKAIQRGLTVTQPENIKNPDVVSFLNECYPDAIVVIAYGQILPPDILKIPPLGCINVHASLLPKYRGAAPIQWALINGEQETGVTTMLMDEGMDTGDILLQERIPIQNNDNTDSLYDKLSKSGAKLLVDTLEGLKKNKIQPRPQDNALATYSPMLKKEDGLINWSLKANDIWNMIRGMNPWPGAYTMWNGNFVKILEAEIVQNNQGQIPGEITEKLKNIGFVVKCGTDALLVKALQVPGSKVLRAQEFMSGHPIGVGDRLA